MSDSQLPVLQPLSPRDANLAARGAMVRISPRKRVALRIIEAVLRPVVTVVNAFRRNVSPPAEPRKILVMEYWNLGDIVMLSPFLRNLRLQFPQAKVTLVTSPKCVPLLEGQGLVDELIVVRVPWAQHYSRLKKYNPFSGLWLKFFGMLGKLRRGDFDWAFTARADIRENFMYWLAKIPRRVGYAFGGGGFLLTDCVVPDIQHPHFSQRWLQLLKGVGKTVLVHTPDLTVTSAERDSVQPLFSERGVREDEVIIGIHAGARSSIRQWGDGNFLAVVDRLQRDFPVRAVWFRDATQSATLAEQHGFQPLNLPLRQFMAALTRCALFICNDSGPMHIAASLGVPVVAVFGPTEPAWFAPLGEDSHIVIQDGFWCRPCFDYCVFDQPYCIRSVTVDAVYASAAGVLSKLKTPGGIAEKNRPGLRVVNAN